MDYSGLVRAAKPGLTFAPRGTAGLRATGQSKPGNRSLILRGNLMRFSNPFRLFALAVAALCLACAAVRAQDYPTKPVKWVVAYPPGGTTDILARLIGQYLSEHLGQQFVIDNRPGAGNNIGTEVVVNAPPDGYTLLLVNPANGINATLYKKLPFNFLRDIAPVAGIIRTPLILEVNPSIPARTVPELIAYAKANPHKLNFASGGISHAGSQKRFGCGHPQRHGP
jgi:tripartite-type tricarboxylate transporter receptor subunit TctC